MIRVSCASRWKTDGFQPLEGLCGKALTLPLSRSQTQWECVLDHLAGEAKTLRQREGLRSPTGPWNWLANCCSVTQRNAGTPNGNSQTPRLNTTVAGKVSDRSPEARGDLCWENVARIRNNNQEGLLRGHRR